MTHGVKISELRVETSPRKPGFHRISVAVDSGQPLTRPERAWIEVPSGSLSEANGWGDSWLVAYLPLALVLGRPLRMPDLSVDSQLLANAKELMAIWSDWYPELAPVAIEADPRVHLPPDGPRKTAAFFSGGVDSFYTLFHAGEEIDDLVFLHGFDIPFDNDAAFQRAACQYRRIASTENVGLIPIATNIRATQFELASWAELSHASLLASAGLQMGPEYSTLLISAGDLQGVMPPHGSHPRTDPLFGTRCTAFQRYGEDRARHEKIEYLIPHPLAINNLRVCYQSATGENCGKCQKCLLVMATLATYGELVNCAAFAADSIDLGRVRRIYMGRSGVLYRSTLEFAREADPGLAAALEAAYRRSDLVDSILLVGTVRWLRRRLLFQPLARRLLTPFYRMLRRLAGWFNDRLPW